jgi:hypothetical protein
MHTESCLEAGAPEKIDEKEEVLTINVSAVYMTWVVMILMRENPFQDPPPSTARVMDFSASKSSCPSAI